ncbi:arginine repressor [Prevotella disiens FB035-09AN]|uniref:Arginine repressor n=1 Tax=Prevotella disiens FB035-09AN TaxID=866771 RepID=E1KQ75_9BACT|nr:arginine repressor [Prevotella disiens]EFL46399.1 arginine repressor [Prevotella disiens FB035-09AN]
MKIKSKRLETIKMLISSMELSSQEEVIRALEKEGFKLTQATLSRDLKQLKVAKAATMNGKYVYVLPNDTMYKRVSTPGRVSDMLRNSGYLSIDFSGQMAIMKTRPGYASAIAYNLDNSDLPEILGTIVGDDTIFIVTREGCSHEDVLSSLSYVVPEVME